MAKPDYIYAVARIRAKELLCFGSPAMEQLMACKTYEECLRMLNEKGWGNGSAGQTPESLLDGERNKTWEQLRELVEDMSVFDVFLYANDYHNLKAAIKENYAPSHGADIYSSNGTIDPAVFRQAADEHDFSVLPAGMRDAAEEAMSVLRETGDGQLCDIIIDKAALNAIFARPAKLRAIRCWHFMRNTPWQLPTSKPLSAARKPENLWLLSSGRWLNAIRSMFPCWRRPQWKALRQ